MKRTFDPFKNYRLDPYEQEIEDALEKGDYKEIPLTQKEKDRLASIAQYTLAKMKKEKRLNIRMKAEDITAIQKKALEHGMPYQTLIGTILHHFATGKITLTL